MSDAKKPVVKPLDSHASGEELTVQDSHTSGGAIKPLDSHASGEELKVQDSHASGEELTTLDSHASVPRPN
ncbi:hypothetical protein OG471_24535 [Streptomyces sp. NBC_01336]|uniref:hypothetical protein n=1 Tax=Streptomyces sp. NBC_01336 TaxID=2903829 RepID=UPI002E112770|nr:hypothetical protein OG471_24535 [Streptomyces sp. NBC_01336]